MMARRFRLAVVVTHNGGDEITVASLKPRDIAIQREIFSVLVVSAMADHVTNIVQERASLQLNACLRGQMVHRLKLIKEH